MKKPVVLVVCTGNSMRSQMAEALLRRDLGDLIEVHSAGTHPSHVHRHAIRTMEEIGIDMSLHYSKSVFEFARHEIDLVITVCDSAKESCPVIPGAKRTVHQGYPDPYHASPTQDPEVMFAELRDRMRKELVELVCEELRLTRPQHQTGA